MGSPPTPPPLNPQQQTQTLSYATPQIGGGVVCPKCGAHPAKPISFTWWGGVIGPKLLKHHKCPQCGFGFNAKTGQSNMTAIIIYQVIVLALVAMIVLIGSLAKF